MADADHRLPAKTTKHVADERQRQHLQAERNNSQQKEFEELLTMLQNTAKSSGTSIDKAPAVAEDDDCSPISQASDNDIPADDHQGSYEFKDVKIKSPEVKINIGNDAEEDDCNVLSPVTPPVDTFIPPSAKSTSSLKSLSSDNLKQVKGKGKANIVKFEDGSSSGAASSLMPPPPDVA